MYNNTQFSLLRKNVNLPVFMAGTSILTGSNSVGDNIFISEKWFDFPKLRKSNVSYCFDGRVGGKNNVVSSLQ